MPFDQHIPRGFNPASIRAFAPAASGVYGISNAREWLFIGETDNIRNALLTQLADPHSLLMQRKPTGFVFEQSDRARRPARQDRLILEYAPTCNHVRSR